MPQQVLLADLLLLRGHVLGCVADYERAAELAEQLVRDAPHDGTALLARARTTFHRFPEALADLDAAARSGVERDTLDAERAAIFQAVGCHFPAPAGALPPAWGRERRSAQAAARMRLPLEPARLGYVPPAYPLGGRTPASTA